MLVYFNYDHRLLTNEKSHKCRPSNTHRLITDISPVINFDYYRLTSVFINYWFYHLKGRVHGLAHAYESGFFACARCSE